MSANGNPDSYSYNQLAEVISQAKSAGQRVKEECAKAIDSVIGDLTQAIKQIRTEPLPEKGIFVRLGARWSQRRRTCRLTKNIHRLEKTKIHIEGSLIDSYRNAEQLTERTFEEIRHPYAAEQELAHQANRLNETVAQIKSARREFREGIFRCSYELDKELQKARDNEGADEASIKHLMKDASFGECQKLSTLDSLNNRARLIGAAVVVDTIASEDDIHSESLYVPSELEKQEAIEEPISEEAVAEEPVYVMPTFSDEVADIPPQSFASASEFEPPPAILEVEQESNVWSPPEELVQYEPEVEKIEEVVAVPIYETVHEDEPEVEEVVAVPIYETVPEDEPEVEEVVAAPIDETVPEDEPEVKEVVAAPIDEIVDEDEPEVEEVVAAPIDEIVDEDEEDDLWHAPEEHQIEHEDDDGEEEKRQGLSA